MDKKSFIIYQDSLDVLDVMTDEQCGKLFKKMKSYHNGNTYVCDDKTVDIVFVQFKNQFDRDKQKYEDEIEKRRKAGALGGKATQSKFKQVQANQASAGSAKANQGDNVNDNVNDIHSIQHSGSELVQIYERCGFEALEPEQYIHKLNLLGEYAIKQGLFIEQDSTIKEIGVDSNGHKRYARVGSKEPDWKKIVIKGLEFEIWLPKAKREVKDFRSTMYTFLSSKKSE